MTPFTPQPYWKPEPRRYSFAWWALLLPAIIYSVGVIVYAHNAFIPDAGLNGHAVGSALMVIGGESGTLAAAAEVFRKHQHDEANALDWLGLFVSLVATLGNLFVVYVALAPLETFWTTWTREYGPLILLLCSGLDFYAGLMEFGFYNASFDERHETWKLAEHNDRLRQRREFTEVQVAKVAETFTGDETKAAKVARKPHETEAQPAQVSPPAAQAPQLSERQKAILRNLRENPAATKTQLAQALGVSRTTVANDMKPMAQLVKVARNQEGN